MINLLIVDDEAIILDGLTELFHTAGIADLEVHRANSAVLALKIMTRSKIDIVLTDIRMPEMSGLELFDQVRERWPRCKVIFLTGYNDFGYVQEVLRKGGADYVLKMDGDEEIVRSVQKTIADIHEETDVERFIVEAKQKMKLLQPLAQREYVGNLVMGEPFTLSGLKQRFEELDIPFRTAKPAYLLLGKVDAWEDVIRPSDRTLLLYALQNIAMEIIPSSFLSLSIPWDGSSLLWLVQQREDGEPEPSAASAERERRPEEPEDPVDRRLQDSLDSIQQAAKRFLNLQVSFSCSGLFDWPAIGQVYDRLRELIQKGAGIGQEISYLRRENDGTNAAEERRAEELRAQLKRFIFLESHLENGKEAEFDQALLQLMHAADRDKVPLSLSLEAFNRVSSLLLSHMNRFEMTELLSDPKELERLTRIDAFSSWPDTTAFFRKSANGLFEHRRRKQADRGLEIVEKIETYVGRNLQGDLSLSRLGQAVYLNPAYLSRLYKQITGVGLSDYVTEKRIQKSKELLRSTDMKIQDITTLVGLESPSYFARLFKRLTGQSPQEFRES
ncbi:response regulator [Cohnella silvisoli]|uniref:Response regulator n=1 Tax=Cohnella silvisoli TaxID=2873699 RepID=A0ABV1KRR6_9BACL|nr:response regulator [Cohnella silvisoli]MCD9022501.1 response regulator [Cohnella silvisoli]